MGSPIKEFFNHLAPSYSKKYSEKYPFLQYFFTKRIQLATNNLDFSQKNILDIGAGTGALYNYLIKKESSFQYYACDISEAMLEESKIPSHQRYVGEVQQIQWPVESFDYIFALGLTSYLSPSQLEELILFCSKKLSPQGQLIISFTNKASLEISIRRWLHPIINRVFKRKNKVSSLPFSTSAYRIEEIQQAFMAKNLYYCNKKWLLPSIPFLHHLLPVFSIRISKFIDKKEYFRPYLALLSHEYLLSFQINGTKTKSPKN